MSPDLGLAPLAGTGVEGLDDILGGGLPRHRLYLLQGSPGAGKTTLALQFLMAGREAGEQGLYITLSETVAELQDVSRSHGWTLDGISVFQPQEPSRPGSDDEQTLFHTSEVELGEAMRTLLDQVESVRPTRVVFDSLSELRLLAQSPLRYRKQIGALKAFFAGRRTTVLLLDDDVAGSRDTQLQTLAHGVIALDHAAPEYGSDRRRLRVTKLRGVKFRAGFHDYRIATGGLRVFPRLVASEHHVEYPQGDVASGVPELDRLLGGGPARGTTMLLAGPPGSGKSVIATLYATTLAAGGARAALFIFDEGRETLFERSEHLGMPLRRFAAEGQVSIRQVDPAEMSPGEFTTEVRHAVEKEGAELVVIDSLNGYLAAMLDERSLTLQLHELFSYLRQSGVLTIAVVAHTGLLGTSMESPVNVSYLADTVMLLRTFEAEGRLRKAISMLKKRSGPHEPWIRELLLENGGVTVGPPLEELHGVLSGLPMRVREEQAPVVAT